LLLSSDKNFAKRLIGRLTEFALYYETCESDILRIWDFYNEKIIKRKMAQEELEDLDNEIKKITEGLPKVKK